LSRTVLNFLERRLRRFIFVRLIVRRHSERAS
jgi:hypothetical protein